MISPVSRLWKNTNHAWGAIAKSFHWLVAAMILGQLVLGRVADKSALSPAKLDLFVWHKSLGVTILLLAVLRLAWRLVNPPPRTPAGIPRFATLLAKSGHTVLYLLMFAVPLSGWWVSDSSRVPFKAFWIIPMPDFLPVDRSMQELAGQIHGLLISVLLAVVLVHTAAALRHHFVLRNETLIRMLPVRRPSE
jgi:cytochrome b561